MSISETVKNMEESLSDFQKHLHSSKGSDIPIVLPFLEEREKCSFYETRDIPLESSTGGEKDNIISFDIKTWPYYELLEIYCNQVIPKIKAIDGIEIKMDEYPLFTIMESVKFIFDDDTILGEWSSEFFFTKFVFGGGKTSSIGNTPLLTEWRETIPQQNLNYVLPLFFSGNKTKSFPLALCGKGNKLRLVLTMKRELKDLIRMRRVMNVDELTGEKEYEEIDFDYRFISVKNDEKKIPTTQMGGKYCIHSEIAEYLKTYASSGNEFKFEGVMMKKIESDGLKGEIEMTIPTVGNPIHSMWWMARGEGEHYFDFSSHDEEGEKSPISEVSLEDGRGDNIFKLQWWNTERIQPLILYNSLPEKRGVSVWSNNLTESDSLTPSGKILDGGKMTFTLEKNTSLEIIVIFIYTSVFRFTSVPTQEERATKLSPIKIGFSP